MVDATVGNVGGRRVGLYSLRGALGWRDAHTDDLGRFVIEGVLPQDYIIQLHAPERPRSDSDREPANSSSFRKRISVHEGETTRVVFGGDRLSIHVRGTITAHGHGLADMRVIASRKGSGDIAINSLTPDTVVTLERNPNLSVEHGGGTRLAYLGFNLRDPILKDVRVRQAIAYALDRRPMIEYLWRGLAQPARSVLPVQSWAYNGDVPPYEHDPEKAKRILDAAGYPAQHGVRFHITVKSSTDANTRLMFAVIQQQLRDVGIVLDIRSFEFATFFSDVQHGAFQMYGLRWIGGNEDPDIFEYAFHSSKFPPNGANRDYYSNPKVDALIDKARREIDPKVRKPLYAEVQSILAEDLPYINLWYLDNVMVHTNRVRNLRLNPAGNFDFLRTAELNSSSN
jgi:peptide/nickel transport system substrate-binding protein